MKKNTLFILVGPTAVGKTSVAVRLAQLLQTQIISADSRQCFKELNIGVAKPLLEELQAVHHFFISSHSIFEEMNAALFGQLATRWATEIFRQSNVAVMVGGTGLYVRAFCEGLDEMPAVDMALRQKIQEEFREYGIAWLQNEIKINDPGYYSSGEIYNPQRLMRALEIKLSTGKSILTFRSRQKKQMPFNIKKIGMHLPIEQLHQNISHRVDSMMEKGLLEEAKKLHAHKKLNALQTVGYTELFDYLEQKTSLDEAIQKVKIHTRQYAKRQMTWFNKEGSVEWIDPSDFAKLKKITES